MGKVLSIIILTALLAPLSAQNKKPSTLSGMSPNKRGDKNVSSKTGWKSAYNDTASAKPNSCALPNMSILSTVVEFGGYPSDADISFINIYGLLGLNFDINRFAYIGPYFRQKIFSTTDYQTRLVEGKTLDISTMNEWGAGISSGVFLRLGDKIILSPQLRIGYNEYTIQDIGYTKANKMFISHRFVNINPGLNLGMKLTDYTIFSLNGGYVFAMYMNGATATTLYNPTTFMYGASLRFYLSN